MEFALNHLREINNSYSRFRSGRSFLLLPGLERGAFREHVVMNRQA